MNPSRHLQQVVSDQAQAIGGSSLLERYTQVRATTLALSDPLSDEDCTVQSMPDASPVKWHLAHTSWFFETFVLAAHVVGYRAFDPTFRTLFNSYYNAVGDKHPRPQRGLLSRPSRTEVLAYRAHVDVAMRALLQDEAVLAPEAISLIVLGTHHEQQHQELILTDVLHMLSHHPEHPALCSRSRRRAARGASPQLAGAARGTRRDRSCGRQRSPSTTNRRVIACMSSALHWPVAR